jgi:hypothetical protein
VIAGASAPRNAAFFESSDELIDKVRYYLLHDYERERIRQAEYCRTMRPVTPTATAWSKFFRPLRHNQSP